MKHLCRKFVSMLLSVLLCVQMLPTAALAALTDNSPEYNRDILSALEKIVGSEDEAGRYYAVLEQYGLLDEDGSMSEDWDIWLDGKQVTLSEIEALLDEPDCDLTKQLLVDGSAITLGDLKTMLEIEAYIAYLRATYFDGTEWTDEQKASLQSLMAQINEEGILMTSEGAGSTSFPSGVNHAARVTVGEPTYTSDGKAEVSVTLSGANAGQKVSFDYVAQSGSQAVAGMTAGTVTLTAGNDGTATEAITVVMDTNYVQNCTGVLSDMDLTWTLQLSGLKNALFTNGRTAQTVVCRNGAGKVAQIPTQSEFTMTKSFKNDDDSMNNNDLVWTVELTEDQRLAIQYGLTKKLDIGESSMTVRGGGRTFRQLSTHDDDTLKSELLFVTNYTIPVATMGYMDIHAMQVTGLSSELQARFGYEFDDDKRYHLLISSGKPASRLEGGEITLRKTAVLEKKLSEKDAVTSFQVTTTSKSASIFKYSDFDKNTDNMFFYGTLNEYYYLPKEYDDSNGWIADGAVTAILKFIDGEPLSIKSITAPAGTYSPGQTVPITVTYSKPVFVEGATAIQTAAGETLYPVEHYKSSGDNGCSNQLTYLYTVKELDDPTISISQEGLDETVGIGDTKITGGLPGVADNENYTIPGVTLDTPAKTDAVTGLSAAVENAVTAPVLKVTATLNTDSKVTEWLAGDMRSVNGVFQSTSLSVSIDGGKTKYPLTSESEALGSALTASVPLDINAGETARTVVAELYLADDLLIGKYASATQDEAVFIPADNLSVSCTVKNKDGSDHTSGTIYLQDEPTVSASFTLSGSGYSFGDTNKVTTLNTDGAPVDSTADFVWSSSDPAVANIDKDGKVTPTGKAGTVNFTLTALNGGVSGKAVSRSTGALTFGVGLTPFLSIPSDEIKTVAGQDVTVFWTSNLCDKNGENKTVFTVTLKNGNNEKWRTTVEGTASAPAASVTIPKEQLAYDYQAGVQNRYTVTVSAGYDGKTYSAQAIIDLSSQPAQVSLNKLNSYYITDTAGSVNIGWNITNFDRYSGEAENLFKFVVTKDGTAVKEIASPGDATDNGTYTGSFDLPIDSITAGGDPTSYRQVYTVTVQAKNGTDSTWSYDSFLLYVYDADALKIWVDGKNAGNKLTMSNVGTISQMSQNQILALKRDIYLKSIISVNYGEYAWTELADQIAWKSSDSGTASVNYQQGTLYENIENFSYTSYRPTTELGLSGLHEGSTTVTATHKLTGISDSLNVTVQSLENKLYLFQCYPQTATTLRFQDSTGAWKEQTSDSTGAAAIYEENGISGNVYCSAEMDGVTYLGTFYGSEIETGEGDWTKLERYPCNNLKLRRAAYAYLYVKNPDGTPYTGTINFRGGVYVNGEYKQTAQFNLNGGHFADGAQDNSVSMGADGKLTVLMDQTQWGVQSLSATDRVSYVFEISQKDAATYYPMLLTINANVNEEDFVGNGEAIVNFRKNTGSDKQPFIILQTVKYANYGVAESILDESGKAGPSDSLPEATLTTAVMWWGRDMTGKNPKLQLVTEDGVAVAAGSGQYQLNEITYPFTESVITQYSVKLNQATMDAIPLKAGRSVGAYLDYYQDGSSLSRRETLSFRLCNMLGMGKVEESNEIGSMLATMGNATAADAGSAKKQGSADRFFNAALELVAGDSYSSENEGLFRIQLAPTKDATKFLGFITVNVGNMSGDQVSGVYTSSDTSGKQNFEYTPGLSEMMVAAGKRSPYSYLMDDYNSVLKRQGLRNMSFQFGGYAESLIYYNELSGHWEIQILNGGFNAGGGVSYSWYWNTMCGPVPFTATLTIGATSEISMDTLSVAYLNQTTNTEGIGNDFLTELRIYLYLRFFAGVGIDYAVVAFKLGIFGQISADLQFQWLNRPYMYDKTQTVINYADGSSNQDGSDKMAGQHFRVDGQVGLEFIVKILFFSYEKILFSYSFNLLNKSTGEWDAIQSSWKANQDAQKAAISALLGTNSLSVSNVGGEQMLSLNLAPTLESRDYLEEDESYWEDGGISLLSLDEESGLKNLQYNAYPYANPLVSDDGELVAYLADMDSADAEKTRAAFATRNGTSYQMGSSGDLTAIDDNGYGDSQLALSGTGAFAVAAWTRQTETIYKDAGSVLTDQDQLIMMNSSEIYASIYDGSKWSTTQLTDNTSSDQAPVTATNGRKAIVAWRAVSSSGKANGEGYAEVADFDEQDMILYRIYDGSSWGEAQVLYNGTSGAVKGITAAMLDDGTAAVAYALDTDKTDSTLTDREIYYAVVDNSGTVGRNVRATNDSYLDENPQLTAVVFPSAGGRQRFVLGWHTEQTAMTANSSDTVSDLRLMDFDSTGTYCQVLPDSISQAADAANVSITPTFRFTKGASSINDLSILWVERDKNSSEDAELPAERDVLKGVKFYTYGQNSDLIGFTGAVDVAEMEDSTLIDHFDAYVSNASENEVKAVILGSVYGMNGTVTRTAETIGGEIVQYTVPSRTTSMYTATETYTDKIEITSVLADYDTVKKGAATQIQFTVENRGIHAVSRLDFTVDDATTSYDDLNLLPGSSIQLYADYTVPVSGVVDPDYTVKATFNDNVGASGKAKTIEGGGWFRSGEDLTEATGTVYLDLPDVQITEAKLVSEQDGQRTIQVKLNNGADAATAKTSRSVKLGFYSDATCKTPITALGTQGIITISDTNDLKMLDEGGYSVQVTLDVSEYLKTISKDKNDPLTEIPDSGIDIFMKAEVIETDNGDDTELPEPVYSNNYANVTCENLSVRTGNPVSVTSDLSISDSGSTVTVSLQNNRLSTAASGNVIVTLLDANGSVLAQQQSYDASAAGNGLISLGKEAAVAETFTFDGIKGASARVTYSDAKLNSGSSALSSLSLDGVSLDYDEATKTYTGSGTDLGSKLLTIVAEDPSTAIRVNGATYTGAQRLSLSNGENLFEITVGSGNTSQTYFLVVANTVSYSGGGSYKPTYPVQTPEKTEHGSVAVSPKDAAAGAAVTITVKPDEGYVLATITVMDAKGNALTLKKKSNDQYTFVMPAGKVEVKAAFTESNGDSNIFYDVPAGTYYYQAVKWAAEKGITGGIGNNLFGPDQPCTRAQIVTFLWRAAGSPEPETMSSFSDVPASTYYAKAVAWAVEHGITTGTGDGKFSPDATCTRAQSVTFLYRALNARAESTSDFRDVSPDAYYADAVAWAAASGITNGIGDGLFGPDNDCTRAQIVTFLWRAMAEETGEKAN